MKPLNPDSHSHRQSGAVAVMVAVLLVVLFGFAALAVDVGNAYLVRGQMQNAADAAAHAGANGLARGMAIDAAKDEAKHYAEQNGFKDGSSSAVVTISIPPGGSESYASNEQYVRAVVTRPTSLILGQILGADAWQIRAEAVAGVTGNTNAPDCLVLTGGTSISGGSHEIILNGCNASISGTITGNPKFTLTNGAKINVYNDTSGNKCASARCNGVTCTSQWCTSHPGPMPLPEEPSYTTDLNTLKNSALKTCPTTGTCEPGRYSSFDTNGQQRTLNQGHYWLDNRINLQGGGSFIKGNNGVTLHLQAQAGNAINLQSGSTTFNVSGPTTAGCPEGGVVIHVHGSVANPGSLIAGSGNQEINIKGIVYAPDGVLALGGNPNAKFYGSVIANSLKLNGNVHTEFSGNPCQHHYTNSGPGQVAIYE